MPSLKEYNVKLASLNNTRKMTRTMKMVSASKLNRAQEAQRGAKLFAAQLNEMISRLSASVESLAHPLLEQRTPRNVLFVTFTSDKGLCAGFNNGMIKATSKWQEEHAGTFESIDMSFIGKRGYEFFKKRSNVRQYYEGASANATTVEAIKISRDLQRQFLEGEYDEIYMGYNTFKSVLSQTPVIQKILPIEPSDVGLGEGEAIRNYIFEPDEHELLSILLPKTINFKIFFGLLENSAGEHGARMTAMDNATTNAENMIETYTLLRNRARQAAITTELIEIISGAEAL